jgi:hypothetical protein
LDISLQVALVFYPWLNVNAAGGAVGLFISCDLAIWSPEDYFGNSIFCPFTQRQIQRSVASGVFQLSNSSILFGREVLELRRTPQAHINNL